MALPSTLTSRRSHQSPHPTHNCHWLPTSLATCVAILCSPVSRAEELATAAFATNTTPARLQSSAKPSGFDPSASWTDVPSDGVPLTATIVSTGKPVVVSASVQSFTLSQERTDVSTTITDCHVQLHLRLLRVLRTEAEAQAVWADDLKKVLETKTPEERAVIEGIATFTKKIKIEGLMQEVCAESATDFHLYGTSRTNKTTLPTDPLSATLIWCNALPKGKHAFKLQWRLNRFPTVANVNAYLDQAAPRKPTRSLAIVEIPDPAEIIRLRATLKTAMQVLSDSVVNNKASFSKEELTKLKNELRAELMSDLRRELTEQLKAELLTQASQLDQKRTETSAKPKTVSSSK